MTTSNEVIAVKLTLFAGPNERAQIDDYFARNRDKKKGETIKRWVLEAIARESRVLAGGEV